MYKIVRADSDKHLASDFHNTSKNKEITWPLAEANILTATKMDVDKGDVKALFNATCAPHGSVAAVRIALAAKTVKLNKTVNGFTPLFVSAEAGDTEVVKLLLAEKGINANKSCQGKTPLFAASSNNHVEVVNVLVATPGIDVNKAPGIMYELTGQTPLLVSCSLGHVDVVKILLTVPGINVHKEITNGGLWRVPAVLEVNNDLLVFRW